MTLVLVDVLAARVVAFPNTYKLPTENERGDFCVCDVGDDAPGVANESPLQLSHPVARCETPASAFGVWPGPGPRRGHVKFSSPPCVANESLLQLPHPVARTCKKQLSHSERAYTSLLLDDRETRVAKSTLIPQESKTGVFVVGRL